MTDEDVNEKTKKPQRQRPTEPLPRNFKPFWLFLTFILGLTVLIALAAYVVDRSVYGW